MPPKKLAKRKRENEVKPISGLDIEALLLRGTEDTPAQAPEAKKARLVGQIGHNDPAKDFKRLMEDDQNSWGSGLIFLISLLMISFQGDGKCDSRCHYQVLRRYKL